MKHPQRHLTVGTRVRARRLNDRSYNAEGNRDRAVVDGKVGTTTGHSSASHGLCYEVRFKLAPPVSASPDTPILYAWFDHDELETMPERLADSSRGDLEARFLEAEENALAWAALGVRSGEHCATRWMEIAGEVRAEIARRGSIESKPRPGPHRKRSAGA